MNEANSTVSFIKKEKTDRLTVTVCEISDRGGYFLHDWIDLNQHLKNSNPSLLIFPDLSFFEWSGAALLHSKSILQSCLENQSAWVMQLNSLHVESAVYSQLILEGKRFFKASYLYNRQSGHRLVRKIEMVEKEPEFWGPKTALNGDDCVLIDIKGYKVGIALDTELWTTDVAGQLAKSEIDLLLCPRASSKASVEQWIRQGQTMAVLSGAYCLSSNKARSSKNNFQWGGRAFIAEPFTGKLLGSTNNHKRFLTLELDMGKSRAAKSKFPLKNTIPNF